MSKVNRIPSKNYCQSLEPGYDEIEDTIQVKSACMLTKKREFDDDEKHQIKFTAQTATGFAVIGVLVGTYIYFKYR